jgi:LPS O-antigen subunit length determinant protein (WzzB/FepE family)
MTLSKLKNTLNQKDANFQKEFIENFLKESIVMNRCFWVNNESSNTPDKETIEAFKWSNELTHRLWNLHFQLENKTKTNVADGIADNINFYAKQSNQLKQNLPSTLQFALDRTLN